MSRNQVPKAWESKAYPSLKPCSAWVDDLMQRLEFINTWIAEGIPKVFWISGFYFPQAFLTGSLQNAARKYHLSIDTVDFDFIVVETPWQEIPERPADGVIIRGLFLEGARWDTETKALGDSLPKQLYTSMPFMHLMPVQHRQKPESGVYRLPIYKELSRRGVLSTTGHSTNFVMWVEVPARGSEIINDIGCADQAKWIKAGVAGFCALRY